MSMAHFSLPNYIPISSLYIPTACTRVSIYFSFLANSLVSSMCIRWLIFFLVIYEVCIRLCISWVYGWVISSLLQIVMEIAHLPWRSLSVFLSQLSFCLQLSIRLSSFEGILNKLWLHRISCTFWDSLLYSFAGLYQIPFCSQSML